MNEQTKILKENKSINFYPWVGEKFQEGLAGKKVLVLGESHYCKDQLAEGGVCYPCCERCKMTEELGCFSQTEDVIDCYIDYYSGEPYQQTFLCFERAVCGREISYDERIDFWNHVAFYNYIQYSQGGPRLPLEEAEDSSNAFQAVLETLMPDCIIIWGVDKLWNRLPDWGGDETRLSIDSGYYTKLWNYTIKGKRIPAMAVYHPSTPRGKSWEYWHQFYKKFIGNFGSPAKVGG